MASQNIVLDMFAGAGGLTEGFFRNDFNIVSHIEMNPHATRTLETRTMFHALTRIGREDLYYRYYDQKISREEFFAECCSLGITDTGTLTRELSADSVDSVVADVRKRLEKEDRKTVDVIIGGPPCQAYSIIGRARDRNRMQNDPRNHLYLHYLKFIKEFKPEIFVFENVPGLISAKNGRIYSDFLEKIKELEYYTSPEPTILNARDFGVLQNRNRIIFIGWKIDHGNLEYPPFEPVETQYKVRDVLKDLPELHPGEGTDGPQKYRVGRPSGYLGKYHIRDDHGYVRHHVARNHNERDREIYRIAIRMWNDKKRLHYNDLPENLKTHNNQSSFLDRFKVVDGDGLSHAVVAHLSKDGHYFIHPDINQARSLTVREAARIQSFPDNYLFEGPRGAQYVQIGNAVPPLMAGGIARGIKDMLARL